MAPQVDDFFMETVGRDEAGVERGFRVGVEDVEAIVKTVGEVNGWLPPGSGVKVELAFTGNSILATVRNITDYTIKLLLPPSTTDAPLDWVKPLGTGYTLWPSADAIAAPSTWNVEVLKRDPLFNHFYNNPDRLSHFFWSSHSFTH
ncbi:hypothetical protein HDU67_001008, partial [Dinochytrium kinnereticum]